DRGLAVRAQVEANRVGDEARVEPRQAVQVRVVVVNPAQDFYFIVGVFSLFATEARGARAVVPEAGASRLGQGLLLVVGSHVEGRPRDRQQVQALCRLVAREWGLRKQVFRIGVL